MSDIMIDAQQVCKNFGQLQVLKGIDLHVPKGNVTCLLGPSGSGKSTFLRCVNHLEKITAGRLYVDGDLIGYRERNGTLYEISEHEAALQRANIGMVFQSYELFPHMSVIDNILLGPLKVQKRQRAEVEAQADMLLKRVGLFERKNAYPRELSGGQKQRIAIVRSLCMNPDIMLFDEVTAALDPEMVREVLDVILGLAKDGMTMLIVTHEMSFARQVANRIVFMDKGQIVEQASPSDFFTNPQTDRAKTFLNILNYEPRGVNYEQNI